MQGKYRLSARSLRRLEGVHPHLQRVVCTAITSNAPIDFTVLEGVRSLKRQRQLFATGKSTTLNSRHLTGHAVDIAPYVNGSVSWDWDHYHPLAEHIKQVASNLDVPLEWGGDWKSFPDGPHWQLSWGEYPV